MKLFHAFFVFALFGFTASAHAVELKLPEDDALIPSGRFVVTPPGTFKPPGDKKAEVAPEPAPETAPGLVYTPSLPMHEDSGLSKLEFLLARGKYAESLQESENILKRHPDNADAYVGRAMAFRALGAADKAVEQLKKALTLNPRHLGANQIMGEMLVEQGEIARAVEQLAVIHMICGATDCAEETALEDAIDRAKKEKSGK